MRRSTARLDEHTLAVVEEARFWQLVERARQAPGPFAERLRELLVDLPDQELFGFQHTLDEMLALSDSAELAGAACLALDSCSDQRFAALRAWLIARGARTFRSVVGDPDRLAELDWQSTPELPELLTAAQDAWSARTGRDDFLRVLPDVELDELPYGDDEGACCGGLPNRPLLARRYPRLAAKVAGARPDDQLEPRALLDISAADPARVELAKLQLYRGMQQWRASDVRALVARICDATSPERPFLVRFLSDLCVPASRHWALDGFDLEAPRLEGYFDRAPLFLERYQAAEEALPALLALLDEPDWRVRSNAAMCVAWFAHSAPRVRGALSQALRAERDPRARASLVLALALQDHYLHDEGSRRWLEAPLAERPPVCDAASVAYYGYDEEPPDRALAGIRSMLLERRFPVEGIPWNDGDLASLGVLALVRRLPARAREVEAILFDLLDVAPRSRAARHALPALLWLVTPAPDQRGPPGARLRRALRYLIDSPELGAPTVWTAVAQLGLPDDPSRLAAWLAELAPSPGPAPAVPADAADPTDVSAGALRAAEWAADAVRAAEGGGVALDAAFDPLVETLLTTPTTAPFFARALALRSPARRLDTVLALASRQYVPRFGSQTPLDLDELLDAVLGVLDPEAREQVLEASLVTNWRAVLKLSAKYPSRRVVRALLPRLTASLRDLEGWAPGAVEQAIERDAAALVRIGPEAIAALGEVTGTTDGTVHALVSRALAALRAPA